MASFLRRVENDFLRDGEFLPWECGDMWPGAHMRDLLVKDEWAPSLGGTFDLQDSLGLGSGGALCCLFYRKDHLGEGAALEQSL